jgi:hypothetical protein
LKTCWTTQAAAPLRALLLTSLFTLLLAACDAFVTGEQVVNFDLKAQADGGYAPITVTLGPEMNPVALNFRAELPTSGGTPGAWNEYSAVLTFNGTPVQTRAFNVNDTSTRDNQPGQPFIARNMATVSVKDTGDYVLTISATKKPLVELLKPQLELRKNIVAPK